VKLTLKQMSEYIACGGKCCPYCGSPELEGGDHDFDLGVCTLRVTCRVCGRHWEDIYTLTSIYSYDCDDKGGGS